MSDIEKRELLTVITPCYNEEETVELFYEELSKYLPCIDMDYEILFVDDGSKDKTLEKCKKLKERDSRIKVIFQEILARKPLCMLACLSLRAIM